MTDVFGKIFGVIFLVILLLGIPTLFISFHLDLSSSRAMLNEMTSFVDKVTDAGYISENDLAEFQLGISSHNAVVDIKVEHYVKVDVPSGDGDSTTDYVLTTLNFTRDSDKDWVQKTHKMNKGDIVKIKVMALDYSGVQKFTSRLTGILLPKFNQTLAGRVRL